MRGLRSGDEIVTARWMLCWACFCFSRGEGDSAGADTCQRWIFNHYQPHIFTTLLCDLSVIFSSKSTCSVGKSQEEQDKCC